jgi:hypothetical protein
MKVDVCGGHGKSEKQHVYLELFVRIHGRQNLELGDHNPPTLVADSKTLGDKPASKAAFAEARPATPAPGLDEVLAHSVKQELSYLRWRRSWRTSRLL